MPNSKPPPYLVADHLALDFLNSVCAPTGAMIDWLETGESTLDWLIAAHAVSREEVEQLRADYFSNALEKSAESLRNYREELRPQISSNQPEDLGSIVQKLNAILKDDRLHYSIQYEGVSNGSSLNMRRQYTTPDMLIFPIALAVADLICNQNHDRIRNCNGPSCTIEFLDISKNGKRRWCSMQVCGNRAKASAHRQRVKKP